MYDTIVLISPEITPDAKEKCLEFCRKYDSVDLCTGEIIYTFTSGQLEGSYDYRIRLQVQDDEWVKEDTQVPERVKTYWHIRVECSLHKLLMNHNCFGGPVDVQKACAYLVRFLEDTIMVKLPEYHWWECRQIDVSKVFVFNNKDICRRLIANIKNLLYTRRTPRYYGTDVHFPGSTTTVKVYWKGPEFEDHDYKRMNKYIAREIDKSYAEEYGDLKRGKLAMLKMKYDKILEKAYRTLRVECSIKLRKLKELCNVETVYVCMLHDGTLEACAEAEYKKLFREDERMETVRRSDLVLERLKSMYSSTMANSLYSVWCQMVQFGEQRAREDNKPSTFRKYRKLLEEAGVSWIGSVVNLKAISLVPEDFSFCGKAYRDDTVDPEVIAKLEAVA